MIRMNTQWLVWSAVAGLMVAALDARANWEDNPPPPPFAPALSTPDAPPTPPAPAKALAEREDSEPPGPVPAPVAPPPPKPEKPPVAYLGLLTEEAPDVLAAQLNLEPGTGLVITSVTPESPAATAGLQKNDALIEFGEHRLSHPAQLRRLVQARKEGDSVQVAYLRNGKKESATIVLTKAEGKNLLGDGAGTLGLGPLIKQLQEGGFRQELEKQLMLLKNAAGDVKFDRERVLEEVRRSIDDAKRAMMQAKKDAVRAQDDAMRAADLALLAQLDKAQSATEKSVIVRSEKNDVRTVVRSDDSGTLVIVSNPKPRLTAHDKDGKLVFDGPISTEEEKAKVPRELRERVEQMLKDERVRH